MSEAGRAGFSEILVLPLTAFLQLVVPQFPKLANGVTDTNLKYLMG